MRGNSRSVEAAKGRWHGILPALGIPALFTNGKNQPCPICGGKDRARFTDLDGNGTYFCSQCGPGNGFGLLMKFHGWDFSTAAQRVDQVVGTVAVRHGEKINPFHTRRAMNDLWGRSNRVQSGDPVGLYLAGRGLAARPTCLRSVVSMVYQDDVPSHHPGMLAMVRAPDGLPSILHRTYLTLDGRKADVGCVRRLMPGTVAKGSAVRLFGHADELGIAEGIETALSAEVLHGIPCWAALSEGMMRSWEPPASVRRVVVFGDNDANYVGQSAAFDLAKRLVRDGVTVDVRVPPAAGDWNDVLRMAE
jgi:putative DNA primase/helicase